MACFSVVERSVDVVNDDDPLSADHVALLYFPPLPLFPCTTSILTINILSPGFEKNRLIYLNFGKCFKAVSAAVGVTYVFKLLGKEEKYYGGYTADVSFFSRPKRRIPPDGSGRFPSGL